jgi:SOS-response transcriptional repressor LexA
MQLTPRQADVLRAIASLTEVAGFAPTSQELATVTGLSETRVRQHLEALEARGAILRNVGTARSVRIASAVAQPVAESPQ